MGKFDMVFDFILLIVLAFKGTVFYGIPAWVFAGVLLLGAGLFTYYHFAFKKQEKPAAR
ncbi:hypothetical protein GKZ89_18860 [Bacillus mangrovi]|uniref:Uncharacterized protein n=1 Tax=Metabacillus mangrovi TaxID=1491830 RepID=A0A7X2V6S6_9BACI|nr:hypothetical protein [Metabacillus mangrovi]MTH55456.1 hypothetical protein [Metabacillus mangrovi]